MIARRSDGGYVSLIVLMMAGLLATLAMVLLHLARPSLELSRLGIDELRADALLAAGLGSAGYLLYAAKHEPRSVEAQSLRFAEGSVKLAVSDDGGRVDLNGSEIALLAGLYSAVGGSSMPSAAFAARVADWRDADGDVTDGGAEVDDYHTAGLSYGPRNGPFQSVEELQLLLGLSRADFARLAPFLTVFNPGGHLDPMFAARTTLFAVPKMNKGAADAFLQRRGTGHRDESWFQAFVGAYSNFLVGEAAQSYRVSVVARLANGYAKAAEAVLIAAPDDKALYRVVAWQNGPAPERPR